jgi:hypothetical protein
MECSVAISEYFGYQIIIKNKLNNLQKECPEEVLKYLLKHETKSRMDKVIKCQYTDHFDKKLYLELTNMDSCKNLKNII